MNRLIFTTIIILSMLGCSREDEDVGLVVGVHIDENGNVLRRPDTVISGRLFMPGLSSADVNVYAWNGEKGELLGSALQQSGGLGQFSITLLETASQCVLIEAKNGTYVERYSQTLVTLSDKQVLTALRCFSYGNDVEMSVNYFTHLSTAYAGYLVRNGESVEDAIDSSHALFSSILGLSVVETVPVNISGSENARSSLTDTLKLSFAITACSPLTQTISDLNNTAVHSIHNCIRLFQTAYEDLRFDGVLNGIGEMGQLSLGIVPVTTDVYRYDWAVNMLAMASSSSNVVGISVADLMGFAESINKSESEIFGSSVIKELNSHSPIISSLNITDGDEISGTINIIVIAVDAVGVSSVTMTVNDEGITTSDNGSNYDAQFDSTLVDDGEYELRVIVTNMLEGQTVRTLRLNVNNQTTVISDVMPEEGQYIKGKFGAKAKVKDDAGVVGVEFIVNETNVFVAAILNDIAEATILTEALGEGQHELVVESTNIYGFIKTHESSFFVDNTAPISEWSVDDFITGIYSINVSTIDASPITVRYYLDNGFRMESNETSSTFEFDSRLLIEKEYDIRVEVQDAAGNMVSETQRFVVDNSDPQVAIESPNSNDKLANMIEIRGISIDLVGIMENRLFIDNVFVGLMGGSESEPLMQINTYDFESGLHDIEMVAVDFAGHQASSSVFNVEFVIPEITNITPVDQLISGTVRFSADIDDVLDIVDVLFIFGSTVFDAPDGASTMLINTTGLNDGIHNYRVEARNSAGYVVSKIARIEIDNTGSAINWNFVNDQIVNGAINISASIVEPNLLEARFYLDGAELATFTGPSINYIINTELYTDLTHQLRIEVEDTVGNITSTTRSVIFDNTAPIVFFTDPVSGSVITNDFDVDVFIDDQVGIASASLLIDDVLYTELTGGSSRTIIEVSAFAEGNHSITVRATDLVGITSQISIDVGFHHIGPSIGEQVLVEETVTSRMISFDVLNTRNIDVFSMQIFDADDVVVDDSQLVGFDINYNIEENRIYIFSVSESPCNVMDIDAKIVLIDVHGFRFESDVIEIPYCPAA